MSRAKVVLRFPPLHLPVNAVAVFPTLPKAKKRHGRFLARGARGCQSVINHHFGRAFFNSQTRALNLQPSESCSQR